MKKLMFMALVLTGCCSYGPGDVVHHKLYSDDLLVLDTLTRNGEKIYILQFINDEGIRDTIHAREMEIE